MATIAFCCGGELTADPSTSSHWYSVDGSVTRDATHVKSGSYALKFAASANTASLRKAGIPGSTRLVNVRFWIYATTAPGAEVRLFETSVSSRYLSLQPDGKLQIYDTESTSTLPLNEFVAVDLKIDTSANPHTYTWKINGTAQTSTTSADAAVDITSLYFGVTSSATATFWYDDIAVSYTAGDYPIPAGTVSGTSTETWTDDPISPTWTTPADTVSMSTTPELKFNSPASAVAQHFYLQLDTANTFATGNLRTLDSSTSQTDWAYWDGAAWTAMPSDGLPIAKSGNEIRYTVTSALSSATWYRRVRAGTLA